MNDNHTKSSNLAHYPVPRLHKMLAGAFFCACSLQSLSGADYSLASSLGSGEWREWTVNSTWNPSTGTPSTLNDSAIFNTGSGRADAGLNLSQNVTIGKFRAGYSTTGHEFGGINLRGAGTTLSVGDASADGYIGLGDSANNYKGTGNLILSDTITVSLFGGQFNVGARDSSAGSQERLIGTVEVQDEATLNVGTSTRRSEWNIGRISAPNSPDVRGTVTAGAGTTVNAYLSNLRIAVAPTNSTGTPTTGGFGTLDLKEANVGSFSVSNNVEIGRGKRRADGTGELTGNWKMGDADVVVEGNLLIGDTSSYAGTSGTAELFGTRVSSLGNVLIDYTGKINVVVDGTSAGLSLSENSTLTINSINGYSVVFNEPLSQGGIYYGLAWEGNHVSSLQSLVASSHIQWTNNTSSNIGVFYDAGTTATYLGISVIPEPSVSMLLFASAGVLILSVRRRERKRR